MIVQAARVIVLKQLIISLVELLQQNVSNEVMWQIGGYEKLNAIRLPRSKEKFALIECCRRL